MRYSTFQARVHAALTRPVYQRCVEVRKVIEELSTKELHTVLPLIIENIFGFNNQPGWGLGTIRAQYQDFRDIRRLLEPDGAFLGAVFKLATDPYLRYEFPLACLPLPTQKLLEEGNVPVFYSDKLQLNQAGGTHGFLSLNAFEYYFFHFSYFLVGPALSRTSGWTNPAESLYPVLLEDYLKYFLPLDGTTGPPALAMHSQGVKSPISHYHSPLHSHRQSPNTSGRAGTPISTPGRSPFTGLLRVQRNTSSTQMSSGAPTSSPGGGGVESSDQGGYWRSSVFLQVLVEFWLNHVDTTHERYSMNSQHLRKERSGMFGMHSAHDQAVDPFQYILFESFLPSLNHVRLVRVLIKHVHYFSNSAKPDCVHSQYSSMQATAAPWDEFKRSVIPQFLQKRLYNFIKHSFEHWPLDSSFRLIMETWLSYVQPWRYTEISPTTYQAHEQEVTDNRVDDKWKSFVMENLLFYTVLFHSVLQRCLRLDLSVSKNAYMLFRATKVFSLPNLPDILIDAEVSLFDPPFSRNPHSTDIGASYLGVSMAGRHGNVPGLLTMQFSELEGPMFQYQPLYSEGTVKLVYELVRLLNQAKTSAAESSNKSHDNNGSFLSWIGMSPSADFNTSRLFAQELDEFGERSGDRDGKRLIQHLEHSTVNLCHIFQIEAPEHSSERSVSWGTSPRSSQPPAETLAPDMYDTDDGPTLSPLGRYQLANGLRKFDVEYDGDPDLQPIRSFESTTLIRMFYALSSYFNEKYHDEMQYYYHHPGFKGRFARQFLCPPYMSATRRSHSPSSFSPQNTSKSGRALSPRSQRLRQSQSEARLSLRWLGSYQNVGYVLAVYGFVYMWWGAGPVGFLLLMCAAAILYGLTMAVVRPRGRTA